MSWKYKLLETYDACSSSVGVYKNGHMLLPIGHLVQRAQIELEIDEEGNFINAEIIDIEDAETVLPVTEDSASRSSGVSPHPLHDKLLYIAKDYSKYVDEKKKKYHEVYMEQLYQWVSSPYTNPIIQAVYAYLLKGKVIEDLIRCRILVEHNGVLDTKVKLQKIKQTDVLVRFKVSSINKLIASPWKDKALFQSFIDYYRNLHKDEKAVCCVTGEQMYCTDKHPSKIRYSSDKAKLISANDAASFTFRGRIGSKEDIVSIGYETSQKIHNALRWLIQEQGYLRDGFAIIIWSIENKPVFNKDIFGREDEGEADLNSLYAKNIIKAIEGYKQELEPRDDVMIMMLDSATEGRLSIRCYQELKASQYYENLEMWYNDCCWMQYRKPRIITTPTVTEIIQSVYGSYRNNKMVVDKKVEKQQRYNLLQSILFGRKVSNELLKNAYHQALHLTTVDVLQYQKCVGILCALMRKESAEKKERNHGKGAIWSMDVKENKENGLESTAYLIGRLMAVYFEIEQYALYNAKEDRPTNAMKFMTKCRQQPWRTLMVMDDKVRPYAIKLKHKVRKLEIDKEEILVELAKREDRKEIRNLDYDFVMGFECQRLYYEKMIKEQSEKNKNADAAKKEDEIYELFNK